MLSKSLFLCVSMLAFSIPLRAGETQIPVDDIDNWFCEFFIGGPGGIEGSRFGHGGVGALAFDAYGNAYGIAGTAVYVCTPDDQVHLLAGLPGFPGSADGPADRACLASLNAIACHPTDCVVYVSDIGSMVIKKIARGADGVWTVATVAGQIGKSGHQDGSSKESLLRRVDGIALDSKGNLYMADQDWLRRLSPDGQLVTLNPKGGSGGFGPGLEHDIESVRFNRIMGAGQLACDENDNVLIADKWNGTFLRIDFKSGKAVVLAGGPARGQPGWRKGRPVDGPGNTEAVFHTGGGPSGVAYDRLTRRIYTVTADEYAIRAIMPDGMVRTLGPWAHSDKVPHLAAGPVRGTKGQGYVGLAGVDLQGRVYVGNRDGAVYRFYRKPAIEGAPEPKTPNPLLPWKAAAAGRPDAPASFSVTLEVPAASNDLAAGRAADCGVNQTAAGSFEAQVAVGGKATKVAHSPCRAMIGASSLAVSTELVAAPGEFPRSCVRAAWTGEGGATAGIEIAASGTAPAVVSDGSQFVVAYGTTDSVYARRVSADGKLLDEKGIKLGGQWEYAPAVASNGEVAVVTASRRPFWNPWGWNGPGAISIGRFTRDGKTPERFGVDFQQLADGGFAGLLDRAQWKGAKGWPAGAPGGFKNTQNGYWPGRHSAVCWDGRSWVVAWVRNKVHGPTDSDIFACRVEAATMMPTGEPVLVAGGADEPGVQTMPALAGLGDGSSALFYLAVQTDGQVKLMARLLTGGAVTGPVRVEPPKK